MTGLLAVKLRRDLRASWSRFGLMVIAITVSLTAFTAVLTAWTGVGRETRGAYVSTEPASATIVLEDGVDPGRMAVLTAAVRERPDVVEAVGRTQFSSRVKVNGEDRAIPMQVFVAAADDPMRMVRFDLRREGTWPPAPGRIWLSGDSFRLLGTKVGDTLSITVASGSEQQVRVAASTYDPSLAPSPQDQTAHAYLSLDTLATAGRPPVLDQLKLQVAGADGRTPSSDRDAVVAVAQDVARGLQRDGLAVAELQVPEPYAHPHQYQADVLFLSLLLAGVVAFLLSTILVVIMLSNLFTRQIPEIGIMKAVGAGSGPIARLYLGMVLVVAAVATAIAIAPGILIGEGLLDEVLGMLGINAVTLAPPWWTIPVVVAVGLGTPVLLALPTLTRASRITVRQAIDHRGVPTGGGRLTGVLTRLGGSGRVNRGLVLALRNAARRPARSLLAVGLLATAGTVFVAGMSLRDSMEAQTDAAVEARSWDVDVVLPGAVPADTALAAVRDVAGVSDAEAWTVTPTAVAVPGRVPVTRTYPDQGHGRIGITAVPAGARTLTVPRVLEGRWLRPEETGAVVLTQVARRNTVPSVRVGDAVQLVLEGRAVTLRVVGVVEEREGSAYATAEGLAAALGGPPRANQLRVRTERHDEASRAEAAAAVTRSLTAAGVRVGSAASVSRAEAAVAGHAGPLVTIFVLVAVAFGVVGGIGLAATMGANVLDRTREFGILHAIGARPERVRRIVTLEGILLTLASCVAAAAPALLLTAFLGNRLGTLFMQVPLPYRISWLGVGVWVVLALLGGALATNAAASGAARITVRQALDQG